MSRPRSTALTSVAKLSSVRTIFAACLRHLRTAPHRHADVGLLERRGVVHGVPGHRDHLAGLLHQPSQPDLVLRGDSPEDVELREPLDDLGVREVRRSVPVMTPGPEAELVGDRARGDRVVARDHPDVDPGAQGDPHRVLGLRAQRVDDPDQRDQDQVGAPPPSGRRSPRPSRRRRDRARRTRAPAALARRAAGSRPGSRRGPRRSAIVSPCQSAGRAALDDDVGSALDAHEMRLAG